MTRIPPSPATPTLPAPALVPGPRVRARRVLRRLAEALGLALAGLLAAGAASAELPVRIAIAPFEVADVGPDGPALEVGLGLRAAKVLTERLALRAPERLLPPGSFVASAEFEPHAESVRQWAWNAAVESVVVGRVSLARDAAGGGEAGALAEVALRSGHSGGELTRHRVRLDGGDSLAGAMDRLASALLEDLGQPGAPPPVAAPAAPAAGAGATDTGAGADAGGGRRGERRGLEADLGLSGFQKDAPIEIHAEEAEIISRDDERRLVFQRNVRVRQANVSLRSDRLEALYQKGESEPRQLVAQGRVHIDQDGRRARCDRAVYVRDDQRLQCSGHAELVQGCDVVRGESIEFDLARDRARVEGAASIVIRPEEGDEAPEAAPAACSTPGGRL